MSTLISFYRIDMQLLTVLSNYCNEKENFVGID